MPLSLSEILLQTLSGCCGLPVLGITWGRGKDHQQRNAERPKPLTSGHLASYPHLLVTLLLRYRLRNQPGLTCKYVAVQVQRWEVVAWRKQKADKEEKDQVSPLHTATFLRELSGAEDMCEQRLCDSLR